MTIPQESEYYVSPTWWNVCANSIIDNYVTLQDTWEKPIDRVHDKETKVRIRRVSSQIKTFNLELFCVKCCYNTLTILLRHYSIRLRMLTYSEASGKWKSCHRTTL